MESQVSERIERRRQLALDIERSLGPFATAHLEAMMAVPRERFVRPEDRERAEYDTPLPLDDSGASTISAPHAYLLSYRLIDLGEGDGLLELGSGSGYGAALASVIVGRSGHVTTVEIDRTLASRAATLLRDRANVRVIHGDAMRAPEWMPGHNKIVCAFAVTRLPDTWLAALDPGAVLVAPVGHGEQRLVRVERLLSGKLETTTHGAVRYVPNRTS